MNILYKGGILWLDILLDRMNQKSIPNFLFLTRTNLCAPARETFYEPPSLDCYRFPSFMETNISFVVIFVKRFFEFLIFFLCIE